MIDIKDIQIDTYNAGTYVHMTIIHIPSGKYVKGDNEGWVSIHRMKETLIKELDKLIIGD